MRNQLVAMAAHAAAVVPKAKGTDHVTASQTSAGQVTSSSGVAPIGLASLTKPFTADHVGFAKYTGATAFGEESTYTYSRRETE